MKIKNLLLLCPLFLLAFPVFSQQIELDPAKGWQGRLMDVGISGTNTFFASASATCGALEADKVTFHQGMTTFSPINLTVENNTQLFTQVDIPSSSPIGLYDVILWAGQGGCEVSCQDCYEIFPRSSITEVTPSEEKINTTNTDVRITTDFSCFTQGSSTCQVNAGNVRFFQPAPGVFDFTPNSVTVVDDKTLIANIDVPSFAIIGDYNVVVAEGYPCEASCENCFEVLENPFIDLISGKEALVNADVSIVLEIFFADIAGCAYNEVSVFLQQGSYTIIPESVTVNGQIVTLEVTIPDDAPLGVYDIVVGDGLGGDCGYVCEGCFTVLQNVGTVDPIYEEELIVYPNPNDGAFMISCEKTMKNANLVIYDSAGKLVIHKQITQFKNTPVFLESKGVYFIKLTTEESTSIQRIVVE